MVSFHVKFLQTDRRTDRRTTVKQYGGIKIHNIYQDLTYVLYTILLSGVNLYYPLTL